MNRSVRVLIAAVIAALFGDAWLSYHNIDNLVTQERTIAASYIRLNVLERTLAAVTDAETGQRGFLLTGDDEYLVPYEDARGGLESDLRELRRMWPASAGRDLDVLDRLVHAKLDELQHTIVLRREGRFTAADALMRRGSGKAHMTAIRAVVDTLRSAEETRLLDARTASAMARRTAFVTAAFASAVAIVAIGFLLALLRRDLVRRTRLAEERAELLRREQGARSEAELANRRKDDFLAALSHELRNPLHAIVGWLQILRHPAGDERLRGRALETIERNARALHRMIEDLLEASRASRGKIELEMARMEVGPLIASVLDTVRPSAAAKGVTLVERLAAAGTVVVGDADRLSQVVINLVSNAIKFTPAGGRVEVALARDDDDVFITVTDSGRGISPEGLQQIFEPFRQAGPRVRGADGGLGLGLSIARHLVDLHGGTITAASEGSGKGACFTVSLPVAREAVASVAASAVHNPRS